MKSKMFIGAALLAAITIYSCQKFENDKASTSLSSSLTGAVSQIVGTQVNESGLADVQSIAVEKFDGTTQAFTFDGFNPGRGFGFGFGHFGPVKFGIPHIDSCATVTVSSSTYPKTITIDYGTGCSDRRGHSKTGKIIISLSDTIANAGSVQTITYQNFYIDSVKVDLTATLKNLGKNASGNWVIETNWDQTITKPSGKTIVQKNAESVEWLAGFGTTDKMDDIYSRSGSGTITINDTLKFSRTITKPLLIDRSCGFIKSGTEELNRNGSIVVIDYGDGTCDSKATVTANDTTEEIDLQKARFHEGGKFDKHCHGGGEMGGRKGFGF